MSEVDHPLFHAQAIAESLQAELDMIAATTNAEEELTARNTEVKCASTSAAYKQINTYKRTRRKIIKQLIKEKREYIEILKEKIAEVDKTL